MLRKTGTPLFGEYVMIDVCVLFWGLWAAACYGKRDGWHGMDGMLGGGTDDSDVGLLMLLSEGRDRGWHTLTSKSLPTQGLAPSAPAPVLGADRTSLCMYMDGQAK